MKKTVQKSGTIAPMTARAPTAAPDPRRESALSPWLGKQVAQRLEEGRTLLIDLATDLPFASVLRGRVAPPREEVLVHAEPVARLIQQFGPRIPGLAIDAAYLRERSGLLQRLQAFEDAGENFLGLIRRTRAVVAAQVEKAMRSTYALAAEVANDVPGLKEALQPLSPVLEGEGKGRRR